MNFSGIVQEVMGVIKRPDKLLDVRREVNSAINQFCLDTNFRFDVVEVSPAIVPTEYTQALSLSLFPRFRKFDYIKRGGTRHFLDRLTRSELIKTNCDMRDKYYIVGNNVNLSLAHYANTVDISYYAAPPLLTDAAPEFWMLELSPYMVIDRTLAKLFTSIGDGDSAVRHERFALSAFLTAQKDYGVATQ